MKSTLFKGFAVFFILLVATSLMMDVFKMDFGTTNYFDKRGIFFLFFITIFPRLTLLFSSVVSGGFFWWLGFIFCPRFLVATLATVSYFHTNPVLVTMSWLIALGGETMEKLGLARRNQFVFRSYRVQPQNHYQEESRTVRIQDGDVIEAEFRKE